MYLPPCRGVNRRKHKHQHCWLHHQFHHWQPQPHPFQQPTRQLSRLLLYTLSPSTTSTPSIFLTRRVTTAAATSLPHQLVHRPPQVLLTLLRLRAARLSLPLLLLLRPVRPKLLQFRPRQTQELRLQHLLPPKSKRNESGQVNRKLRQDVPTASMSAQSLLLPPCFILTLLRHHAIHNLTWIKL
jgi:hypothetical protein